jgi:hypothetical protein
MPPKQILPGQRFLWARSNLHKLRQLLHRCFSASDDDDEVVILDSPPAAGPAVSTRPVVTPRLALALPAARLAKPTAEASAAIARSTYAGSSSTVRSAPSAVVGSNTPRSPPTKLQRVSTLSPKQATATRVMAVAEYRCAVSGTAAAAVATQSLVIGSPSMTTLKARSQSTARTCHYIAFVRALSASVNVSGHQTKAYNLEMGGGFRLLGVPTSTMW